MYSFTHLHAGTLPEYNETCEKSTPSEQAKRERNNAVKSEGMSTKRQGTFQGSACIV
jgi:hypothetical protein